VRGQSASHPPRVPLMRHCGPCTDLRACVHVAMGQATIGCDFLVKEIRVGDALVTIQLWDTAGGCLAWGCFCVGVERKWGVCGRSALLCVKLNEGVLRPVPHCRPSPCDCPGQGKSGTRVWAAPTTRVRASPVLSCFLPCAAPGPAVVECALASQAPVPTSPPLFACRVGRGGRGAACV
jgi:hypothetical protein